MANNLNIPLVSVIMSVYKEPLDWLRQSIDSILNQTFKVFEFIIICDNPEYDEGIKLLRDYSQKDNRIILLYNENNIGLTKSLNKGLSKAKGVYIARMDADDISMPNRIIEQFEYLENHEEVAVCGSFIEYIDEYGKVIKKPHMVSSYMDIKSLLFFGSQLAHPSVMFRRIINGIEVKYDESLRYAQDYSLWATLIMHSEIINIPRVLLKYRVSGKQISKKNLREQNECSRHATKQIIKALELKCNQNCVHAVEYLEGRSSEALEFKEMLYYIERLIMDNRDNNNINYSVFKDKALISLLDYMVKHIGLSKTYCHFFSLLIRIHSFRIKPILILFKLTFPKSHSKLIHS